MGADQPTLTELSATLESTTPKGVVAAVELGVVDATGLEATLSPTAFTAVTMK
jgi:hypothetical protein